MIWILVMLQVHENRPRPSFYRTTEKAVLFVGSYEKKQDRP